MTGILCKARFAEGLQASLQPAQISLVRPEGNQALEDGEVTEEQRGPFLA